MASVVRDHDRFEREGSHLYSTLSVSYLQALLGAELEFKTLLGKETIRVPAGTQPGARIRVEGQGVPMLRGRGHGDLILQVEVKLPTKLSREEEKLLRQIAEEKGENVAAAKKGIFG